MSIHKILIVDDSTTDREVLNTLLLHHGFQVITAADGQEGIELARAERPDLILMDVVMPRMNGFQATRTLARDPQTRHIPIVFCSNLYQEADRVWGMRQGAHAYLDKPVKTKLLLDTIAALAKSVPD
jgi:twitching motility two-component system response regulator PilH